MYHVILINDEFHTYNYVINMLGVIFGYNYDKALAMAREVDSAGRVILLTTHLEMAELKKDQIHSFGADRRLPYSAGSMSAIVEQAP